MLSYFWINSNVNFALCFSYFDFSGLISMKMYAYKELSAVVYGESAVKIIENANYKTGEKCFGLHWHDRIELLRIKKGKLLIRVKEEEKVLQADEMAIVCPCQLHKGIALEDDTEYNVIMFNIEDFSNATTVSKKFLKPIANSIITFNNFTSDKELIKLADEIVEFHKKMPLINPLQIHGCVYNLLGQFYLKCSPEQIIHNPSDEKFNAVIDYINKNYIEKITTKNLSEMFGYDEAYFCRKFKKVTGIPAMKYINILRLEQAQHLLKRSDEEIGTIATKCGFSDISYFTQSFHSHCGMSPTDFRKRFGN